MFSGNQPGYLRIAPKPVAMPTSGQLSTSSVIGTARPMSTINAPPVYWSTLPVPRAQSQSTPPVRECGDMVAQMPLLLTPGVSSVAVQDPSSTSPIFSLTGTTPSLHSSGNTVTNSQSAFLDEILPPLDFTLDEPRTTDNTTSLLCDSPVAVNEPDLSDLMDWLSGNSDITPLEELIDNIESGTHVQVWILV